MRIAFAIIISLLSLQLSAQDTTMATANTAVERTVVEKQPVRIFSSERVILSNTTEPVGKGKMKFIVSHYFDDAGGSTGGFKNFFGLDNSQDVWIGFRVGLTDRLDATIARAKSGHPRPQLRMEKLYELALKYQLLQQIEKDPSHPIALSVFFSNVISGMDTAKTTVYDFKDFGDRMSQVYQLIIAKKIGKISLQLSPTITRQGYLAPHDLQRTMFSLGGVIRFPVSRTISIVLDYFHPFRSQESEDAFKSTSNFNPPIKFHDPLGIGFEINTSGHVFYLNFTNATQIQEARFIPYNVKDWGDGEFRWGFTISRKFILWRDKK